ncbi:hypothetical protein, partial [Serratia sp. (in: enterobacteria)]|uniref:hypothetical protein n=1 Tax=Serratia sp. (in: enterobacteria) TaxID=616 RepID=UPI0039891D46
DLSFHGISSSTQKYSYLCCKCLPCPRTSVHDVPGLYTHRERGLKALCSAGRKKIISAELERLLTKNNAQGEGAESPLLCWKK